MTQLPVTRDEVIEVVLKRPIKEFLAVTDNQGGYTGGFCIVCNSLGWIEHLETDHKKHKPTCPIGRKLEANFDPDK